ncbi:MAG: virulence factor TspB C-terminal domain-related protein [Methylococcaceae bacterium]
MDYVFRSLIFFFVSFPALAALPSLPTFGITRAGPTTTYTVGPSTFQPATLAPTGTGLQPLNSSFSAAGRSYVTTSAIPVGETIAAVRVSSGISAAALASSVLSFAKSPLGIVAIVAGTALYDYLHQSNLQIDAGQIKSTIPIDSNSESAKLACQSYWMPPAHTLDWYGGTPSCTHSGSNWQPSVDGIPYYHLQGFPYTPSIGGPLPIVSDSVATQFLTDNQPIDAAPVIKQIYDADPQAIPTPDIAPFLNLDASPMYGPSDSNFNPGHMSAPQTTTSAPSNTTTPTGTTQSSTTKTDLSQPSSTTITSTATTTTTTTNIDNSTRTTTTTNAPAAPSTVPESKTDCDKYPDNIGCSKYGLPDAPQIIPIENIPLSNSYTSWGSGICPSPVSLPHGLTFKYEPMCSALVILKPILIAMGLLISMFIVYGGVKS